MAIERTGWPLRPTPAQKDSGRRKQPEQRPLLERRPQKKRNDDPNQRPGHIDELV